MYHKVKRPLGVGVGMDSAGPKRFETRGPKIMETPTRRRRLGSVNTGSGSETEDERKGSGEETDFEEDLYDGAPSRHRRDEMELDTPETPDDTPVSLVNLAILLRKAQRESKLLIIFDM
jgi:hypothetical protein